MSVVVAVVWLLSVNSLLVAQQPFITTWRTTNIATGSSNSTSITIPTTGTGYNYDVDWNNDGVYEQTGITGSVTHNFGGGGTRTIRIRGAFPRIFFASGPERLKLLTVVQWGDIAWTSMQYAFSGCSNLNVTATDVPNLSGVTDMSFMFDACSSLSGPANIGVWNTATVTNMGNLFFNNLLFNQPLTNWNTDAVTNMARMFTYAVVFNQPLAHFNTGSVVYMYEMFRDANVFNQPIGNWNTSSVIDMNRMFEGAAVFNQPIGDWNTGSVRDMSDMFTFATSFNQPIGNWNTASVTDMSSMFQRADVFNQPIGDWNTASVTNMRAMFSAAYAFDQPIGNWNTGSVTNMNNMLSGAISFNQPIGDWNTSSVANMASMFAAASSFDQPINNWNTASVTNMSTMFYQASAFDQPLDNWNTSAVTTMYYMFNDASSFNQPIGSWNTAAVTNMQRMFFSCDAFNQPIEDWNTAAVTTMREMFYSATAFNQSLGGLELNAAVDMVNMLSFSGLDCDNYSKLLITWAANPAIPSGRSVGTYGLEYGTTAVAARTYLDVDKAWTFFGDVASGEACGLVLPVEWILFTGKQQENDVVLNWQTAREQQNLGFDVERSADGIRWDRIGFVPASTDNSDLSVYSFIDKSANQACPANCVLYYRLRQKDLDGKEELSKIITINLNNTAFSAGVQVFPNPVRNEMLTLVFPEIRSEEVAVRLVNASGQVVRSGAFESGTHHWDLRDIPSGMYTLIGSGEKVQFIEKIVVEK